MKRRRWWAAGTGAAAAASLFAALLAGMTQSDRKDWLLLGWSLAVAVLGAFLSVTFDRWLREGDEAGPCDLDGLADSISTRLQPSLVAAVDTGVEEHWRWFVRHLEQRLQTTVKQAHTQDPPLSDEPGALR